MSSNIIPIKCTSEKCRYRWTVPASYTAEQYAAAIVCPCGTIGKPVKPFTYTISIKKTPKK